ncbi:MAG: class I SAM-dependent methyltransferase [Candidatus Vogelbacteria bacterium]
MSLENKLQVKGGHYKRRSYNTLERFISYYYQIKSLESLSSVVKVLEIGPGSKLVSRELSNLGYQVTTCDFDSRVNPDIISDVRQLSCGDNSFDCVIACQILEHIPYDEFETVLENFARISKRFVLISLPQRNTGINLILKFPFIQTLFKRKFFDWSILFPVRFPGFEKSGQHHWEIDGWTIYRRQVRRSMEKHFRILQEFSPPLNKYHRFFILEKHEYSQ